MRKILRFLMLVLMATWGAESYAECIQIKAAKVTDDTNKYTDGDITISITAGVEDETYWKGLKRKHRDKTVDHWDIDDYWGANTGETIIIPVGSDFTVSCKDGYIDYILFSFNNGIGGSVNHSEYWDNIKVSDGTDTKGSYYHKHENNHLTNKSWWGGYGSGSSSVTFYDNRTTADEGDAQTTGLLWLYVFYHKTATITPTAAFAGSGRDFCKSDTTVALNLSSSMNATNVNNYSSSAMRYTIDGNAPTTSSSTYGSGIKIDQTRTIKVINQAWLKVKDQGGDAGDSNFSGLPDTYSAVSNVVTVGTIEKYCKVDVGTGKNGSFGTLCHDNYMRVPTGYVAATYQIGTTKNGSVTSLKPLVTYTAGEVIPPKTPVVVAKISGNKNYARFANPTNNSVSNPKSGNTSSEANCLSGNYDYSSWNLQTKDNDNNCYYYFLMKESTASNSRVGFFWAPSTKTKRSGGPTSSLGAHKVYFKYSRSNAAKGFVFQAPFDDDDNSATGIVAITTETKAAYNPDAPMYNAAGQRVGASYKGIVIQNGRKFVKR